MPAAIFNVDHTLVNADVTETFHAHARDHGLLPAMGTAKLRVAGLLRSLLGGRSLGTLDPARLRRHLAVNAYRGADTNDLRREARKCFKERLQTLVLRDARAAVTRHVEAGDEVILAGPCPDFLMTEMVSELGAHSGLGIRPNLFGTRVQSYFDPIPYGSEKLKCVREALERLELKLGDATAYASDASDLPLLEAVGTPVAVNPTPELEAIAKAKGWRILTWSTTGRNA